VAGYRDARPTGVAARPDRILFIAPRGFDRLGISIPAFTAIPELSGDREAKPRR
jgi:hypothetical protein